MYDYSSGRCSDSSALVRTRPRAPVKYSGGLSNDLRPPREDMQIVHHSTAPQVKQVLALSTVTSAGTLPVTDVREVVLDPNALTQGGAPFARALTDTKFLQQLLIGVQADAASALAAGAARSLRARRASLCGEMHGLPRLTAHLDSLRTTQRLSFPIHYKGSLGEQDACSHRPSLAENLQLRTALADQRARQISSINMQFFEGDLLLFEIPLDPFRDACLRRVGPSDADRDHQLRV